MTNKFSFVDVVLNFLKLLAFIASSIQTSSIGKRDFRHCVRMGGIEEELVQAIALLKFEIAEETFTLAIAVDGRGK